MDGQVDGTPTAFILDTGAAVTLLRRDLWDRGKQPPSTLEPWSGPKLVGANGTPIRVIGTATVNLTMAHKTFPIQVVVAEPLTAEAIMGLDFLEKNKCVIQADRRILTFARDGISVPMIRPSTQPHAARISVNLIQPLQIPACSEQEVMARMEEKICGGTWMIESENLKNPDGQLARWLEQLAEYDFTIIHRAGSKHGNADALSRIPCHHCGRDNHFEVVAVATPTGQRREHRDKHTSEMRKLQLSDTVIGPILQAKEKEQKPSPDDVKVQPRSTSRLVQQWDQLEVKGGLLWRVMENVGGNEVRQLIVSQGLRTEVLQELHSGAVGGHLGEEKTLKKLKERFYWPGHANDVKNWCRACPSCSTRKTPTPKQRAPLGSLQAGYPMQIVSVDILGPLPMTRDWKLLYPRGG